MAGESDRNTDPVAKKKAELDRQQAPGDQSPQRHWSRTVILVIVGGFATIAGLVRPIVNPPHDIWVVAFGVACILAAMAVGLHEIVKNWGKTFFTVWLVGALFVVIVADSWTHDYEVKHPTEIAPSTPPPGPTAQFEPPTFEPEETPYIRINAGTIVSTLNRFHLAPCPKYIPGSEYSFPPTLPAPLILGGFDPISICTANNRVFVDVRLWNDSVSPKAEIVHNHFAIEPEGWHWNFDSKAFEAVDEKYRPMLQLIYRSPSEVDVRGVFITNGAGWLLTDKGSTMDVPLQELPQAIEAHPITRIFKYPSETYPQVRE
jgi:hypothetical protein